MTLTQRIVLATLLMLAVEGADAHTAGTSFLSLQAGDDSSLQADWDFDVRDLHQLLNLDKDADGAVTWGEIENERAAIEALVLARTRLSGAGRSCTVVERQPLALAEHGDGPYLRLGLRFSCSQADSSLTLDHSGWFEFDPGHRALLEYRRRDGSRQQAILSNAAEQWRVSGSRGSQLVRFLIEGMRHLVTGYDHLAFLGVLLLALARRPTAGAGVALGDMLRRAVAVVTAFTLAHSLTLGLAATGYVTLPGRPVEIAIAASVLLAALLNLRRNAARHGWKLAFAFGLVHGLGFAGALAALASGSIDVLALAAFNLGIEAAQVALAAVAVPLIWRLLRSQRSERVGVPLASLSVACLAAVWLVARAAG